MKEKEVNHRDLKSNELWYFIKKRCGKEEIFEIVKWFVTNCPKENLEDWVIEKSDDWDYIDMKYYIDDEIARVVKERGSFNREEKNLIEDRIRELSRDSLERILEEINIIGEGMDFFFECGGTREGQDKIIELLENLPSDKRIEFKEEFLPDDLEIPR